MINMKDTKEQQIKEVLKAMSLTLDNNEWKQLLKKYHELKQQQEYKSYSCIRCIKEIIRKGWLV